MQRFLVRTNRATAPEHLNALLRLPVISFTTNEAAEMLGISRRSAHQAIAFGMAEEKIRIVIDAKYSQSENFTVYENASWRRQWICKPWV